MEGNEAAVETPVVMTGEGSRYALSVFTASTTATSDIFILAPPKFLGDRSPAYGRHLTVTTFGRTSPATAPVGGALPAVANSSATTGLDEGLHVILEGKYAPLAVSFAVGVFASDGEATAKIPVMEGSWKLVNTTQTNNTGVASPDLGYASFSQFMEILADLSSLKLKVYDTDVPGSVIDIISVHLENAVDGSAGTPNSGVSVVNNVGLCQCQEGYSGRLCELCAAGFTRVNPGVPDPSSLCVACTCNGHGVTRVLCDNVTGRCSSEVTGPCDPVSGVCECRHNTQGDHCQECLPGYYGDATVKTPDDCLPCACPGIVVANEINAFAATCQLTPEGTPVCVDCRVGHTGDHCERCQEGYFGTPENITNVNGICQPCACNGRADLCDTITGQCLDCRNDTAGHNCQICAPGFFGDPMTSECQPCTCDTVPGSTGACDHVTGVCECLPNVSGNNCDTCDDTTFNLTQGLGCQSCDCHQSGSLSVVCDKVTGQCPCRQRVEGRACDRCLDTYWNININTGCDECACNAQGTIKINDAIDPTCDVITGQCNCALEGIIGRTCDSCAPVSTYPFQYVQLFYIGEFPDCQLCGECFDSWAMAVEGVGADLAGYKGKLDDVWAKYDGKTQDEVGPNLDVIADKINQTTASLEAFKTVAQQLQNLGISFSEAVERQNLLAARTDAHAATELTQTATVTSLEALNDVVQGTGLTTVSLSGLQQQLDDLIRDSLAIANQGNSSWSEIQTLSFVVASPEDRERQLKQQAQRSMQLAAITNESFVVLKTGYETAAIPGVTENEREINSVSGRITNVTATLADARAVLSNVLAGLQQSQTTLDAMVNAAQVARETMLATVITLQDHVANSSIAQREAGKVAKLAHDFRTVADNAQQVMIDSMTSVIESFGSLSQTQNDMATAQLQSSRVQSTQLQPLSDMEQLVQQIDGAAVSLEDVTSLNVMASTALFVAEDAVRDSQEALQVSKQLKEEVDLMQEDVQTSRDLRVQVTGLKNASDSINTTARNVLEEAGTHINSTQEHVRAITATAQELSANISTLSNFYTTTETDVTNAATTAGQVQARAATATNNQQALLETMSAINAEADESGVAEALTTMTQAQIDITDLEEGLNQLITTEEMQALIQDLVSQGEELRVLDIEVDQLTSQLDILTVALQESAGGVTCKN
ncbi:laminin subunit beta-4 [Aplysia californica]|uniref:Laminin subunit beta-4 n=1 Tax=Aplysia californica TaxID=6500 RepID=A0ABM1A0L9_APLCA|nr:laminin subunit beta-4 [Aplysia californica]